MSVVLIKNDDDDDDDDVSTAASLAFNVTRDNEIRFVKGRIVLHVRFLSRYVFRVQYIF